MLFRSYVSTNPTKNSVYLFWLGGVGENLSECNITLRKEFL